MFSFIVAFNFKSFLFIFLLKLNLFLSVFYVPLLLIIIGGHRGHHFQIIHAPLFAII